MYHCHKKLYTYKTQHFDLFCVLSCVMGSGGVPWSDADNQHLIALVPRLAQFGWSVIGVAMGKSKGSCVLQWARLVRDRDEPSERKEQGHIMYARRRRAAGTWFPFTRPGVKRRRSQRWERTATKVHLRSHDQL